jgi:SAM-dependent methyltransferase
VLAGAPLPCTAIHLDDSMLRFFVERRHGHRERALVDYFRTGLAAARAIETLVQWWFGAARPGIRMLDFASGYGRITRFLVQRQAADRLWVADLVADAVEFQRRCFGVGGLVSTADPMELPCDESFDCIVVSSLFSHLPPASFAAWLRRLAALLRPGGLLLFSVHDVSLRPLFGKPPLDAEALARSGGIHYESDSEIPGLQGYGSTWVDETFVHRAVAEASGGAGCVRLPRALSSFHDYYAVGRPLPGAAPPSCCG